MTGENSTQSLWRFAMPSGSSDLLVEYVCHFLSFVGTFFTMKYF